MLSTTVRRILDQARDSPRVHEIRNAAARRIAAGKRDAGFSGYGQWWSPEDETHAMQLVLNETDVEVFEKSGKADAAVIAELVAPGDTVMDVGCGIGRVARYVAPLAQSLWAVDASPAMLTYARKRLSDIENIKFATCDDTKIPDVADDSVDIAYSVLVLQHMDRDDAFRLLVDINRTLKPSGRALFTFPNLMSDTYRDAFVRHALDRDTHPGRARYYTPQEVARVLPAAGFDIEEIVEEVEIRAICKVNKTL